MTTISSIDARFAQDQVGIASRTVTASVQNLVSGTKADANVADLSVGTVLAARVGTLRVTVGNAGQAKSLLETAKGALNTILGLLQKQKNLAVKAADDSLSNNERGFLNQEFQAIVSEVDRIASTANFNGKSLLDGSISGESTVKTATGLSKENYGTLGASDTTLKGTVATGDLITTASNAASNRVTVSSNGTASSATVFTIRDENAVTAAISFTSGTTINETINNLATAVNEYTSASSGGSNSLAAIVQNFKIVNNGDNTFNIVAKEAGTQFNKYDFNFSTVVGITATIGVNGTLSDIVGTARTLDINTGITGTDYALGANGTFGTVAANNVGQVAGISQFVFAAPTVATAQLTTLTITDVKGVVGTAGLTATISWTSDGTNTAEESINNIINVANGGTALTGTGGAIGGSGTAAESLAILRSFVFQKVSASTLNVVAANKGTAYDGFTFGVTSASFTVGSDILYNGTNAGGGAAAVTFLANTEIQTSADRGLTTTDATINANLSGALTNFKATFNQGNGLIATAGQAITRNSLNFTVDVNGKTYVSDPVYLFGGSSGATNLNVWGNTIAANQVITFSDPDGPKDANGILTDNAFTLRVGSTARTLSDLSTNALATSSANTIADSWETQLAGVTIDSNRSLNLTEVNASNSDHRITKAIGTVLEGLRGADTVGSTAATYHSGDITLSTSAYSDTGTLGSIGKFDVDRLAGKITTTIDGELYTAYLSSNDIPATGNVVAFGTNLDGTSNIGAYNSTTKILDLQTNTAADLLSSTTESVLGSAKLHFFSASTTDGRVLTIDLGNVALNTSQINISTNEGETALESALNAVFGVSSSDSLSFQVGAASTDTIGVSIGSAKTDSLYKDDNGVAQVIDVATKETAIAAGTILDNAIHNVVALVSSVSASITSFDSSIQNNQASIQNADAARSKLLDTDYTAESTRFAEARVRVDAATAVLAQVNTRIQNLLSLLRQ
jgi:flagellin